jgi:hypothetical protein
LPPPKVILLADCLFHFSPLLKITPYFHYRAQPHFGKSTLQHIFKRHIPLARPTTRIPDYSGRLFYPQALYFQKQLLDSLNNFIFAHNPPFQLSGFFHVIFP